MEWKAGMMVRHSWAPSALLEIVEVSGERVRARLVKRGRLKLREGRVYRFRTKYLIEPEESHE